MAIEDIVNEAYCGNEIDKDPVRVDLSDTGLSSQLSEKLKMNLKSC